MKKQDLTKHSKAELLKLAADKREELRVLRFGGAGSKNRNVKQAKMLRKDVARALTQAHKVA
ncbi:MAG TPA: 50S ribosomal protein L29 [Candidatus Paceibacterota bacterium]|jgi:ribosomal protein L29|nr:50S ribosomal protein L29 [Candidatus Paceibacterota bacterium]